ncbi:MAG: chorismate lyase [Methylovulum sp.]|uniref:chorismate--pyruvate lyase family protein n=1 Tax=Methylovulum sp. TaxID=1916980 RepID=UPI0026386B29|nr:chorismate lyase [Methylovulum sp.]MDD2724433.1 chorismate lyase [Methylovulum sp.]MDD5123688.1 chorismate lyase [Methylovulum sp.]
MTTRSQLFLRDPQWRENRRGTRHQLPTAVQSWTYETGSLTQRLRRTYGNAVKVSVLWQQWQTPFLSEQHRLQIPTHIHALVREVLLHADGKPLILARTVIPADTITFAHSNLAKLGTRPLGEVIFAYPKLARLQLDVCQTQPYAWIADTRELAQIDRPVWGRRTVYGLQHQHLLVSEFFLADSLEI